MKILLTNDDGTDAIGINVLADVVRSWAGIADEVIVVAPDRGRSECGHSVTTGRRLRVWQRQPNWFAVDGTPVDCVRAALTVIAPDCDLVISGINAGANLGVDILVSGTVAAAREAALHGVKAMAVSQYRRGELPLNLDHVQHWLPSILQKFRNQATDAAHERLWNVNLPALAPGSTTPRAVECVVDTNPLVRTGKLRNPEIAETRSQMTRELILESDFQGRPRGHNTDVALCFAGAITISKLTPIATR